MATDPVLALLAKIRPRPAMYIGRASAEALLQFLAGYTAALADHTSLDLDLFTEFIGSLYQKYGFGGGGHSWAWVLGRRAGGDRAALDLFFQELDAFLSKPRGADSMDTSITTIPSTLGAQVSRLLDCWRHETAHLSSSTRRTNHPAYLELIQLGTPALPFLFRDIEKTGDGHLAKALTVITGVNPVPEEDYGRIDRVAETWVRWARENGISW